MKSAFCELREKRHVVGQSEGGKAGLLTRRSFYCSHSLCCAVSWCDERDACGGQRGSSVGHFFLSYPPTRAFEGVSGAGEERGAAAEYFFLLDLCCVVSALGPSGKAPRTG